ncbi:hypothetical protein JCM10213_003566 [Rhodosporidiobolus nylandii]
MSAAHYPRAHGGSEAQEGVQQPEGNPGPQAAPVAQGGYAGAGQGCSSQEHRRYSWAEGVDAHGAGLYSQETAAAAVYGRRASVDGHGSAQGYQGDHRSSYAAPSFASPSPASYERTHPLYAQSTAAPVASTPYNPQQHHHPPPVSHPHESYSHPVHPAYASSLRRSSTASGYSAYQPYAAPASAAGTSGYAGGGPSSRPGGGAGLMGQHLPPMSLTPLQIPSPATASGTLGPSTLSASSSAPRRSLPSLAEAAAGYDQPMRQHYQQPLSASASAIPSTHIPYHHSASADFLPHSQPAASLHPPPMHQHLHSSTPFAHPAYSRTSPNPSPWPTSATSSGSTADSRTSTASSLTSTSAATAATALSSLVAAASSPAVQPAPVQPPLPKPSTSSSVPNSPWAGPPPPATLTIGGLAKRRRSATDALGLGSGGGPKSADPENETGWRRASFAGPAGGLGARRTSGGLERERVAEEEDEVEPIRPSTSFDVPPSAISRERETLAQRRGSDGTLLLPSLSLNRPSPVASTSSLGFAPPPLAPVLQLDHSQTPHPPPRTVVTQNSNGTTSVIKEPRASSPLAPPPPATTFAAEYAPRALPGLVQDDVLSNTPSPTASAGSAGGSVQRGRKRRATTEDGEEDELDSSSVFAAAGVTALAGGTAGGAGVSGKKEVQEKKFVCPHPSCGRAFARNFNLQSHIKSHQGIREYKCPECDKLFSRKHDCTRHCISIHGYDKDFMAKAAHAAATSALSGSSTSAEEVKVPMHVPQPMLPVGEMVKRAREQQLQAAAATATASTIAPFPPSGAMLAPPLPALGPTAAAVPSGLVAPAAPAAPSTGGVAGLASMMYPSGSAPPVPRPILPKPDSEPARDDGEADVPMVPMPPPRDKE